MSEKVQYVIELNDRLSPGLKKAAANALGLDRAMGGLNSTTKKSKTGFGNLTAGIKRLAGPLVAAGAAMKVFAEASQSVRAAREFESLTNAINFASGGAEEGARTMEFLRDRSKLLGTDLLASTEGFKTLSAAMLGSSLQGEPTKKIFEGVQVAASAMGLSSEQAKGTFLALGQIMGKGKVQAEELRGQIGERIPGAFNIAAKAMGVTTNQLNKMLEQGELLAEDFLPKFSDELKRTFGDALKTSVNSSQAQINRFNNLILEMRLRLGRALLPIINKIMTGVSSLFSFLNANKSAIMVAFSPLIDIWNEWKMATIELSNALGFTLDKTTALSGVLTTIKVVLKGVLFFFKINIRIAVTFWKIVIRVGKAIGSMFNKFTERFPKFTSALSGIVEAFKEFFKIIRDDALATFRGISDVIEGVFTGNKDLFKKGVKGILTGDGESAGKRLKEAFKRGFESGGLGIDVVKVKGDAGEKTGSLSDVLGLSTGGVAGGTGGTGGKQASTKIDEIKSGRPTHINIDIGKLIETMTITATDVDDLTGQVKDAVTKALLTSVNNANLIAR